MGIVKGIWQSDAYRKSPDENYDPSTHPAVLELMGLESCAKHGVVYARNMNERLAKAWAESEHREVFRKLDSRGVYPSLVDQKHAMGRTAISIEGGLHDFETCFYIFKDLAARLDSSFQEAEAQKFSEQYGPVSGLCDSDIVIRRTPTSR